MTRNVEKLTAQHERLWNHPARGDRLVTFAWNDIPRADYGKVFADCRESFDFAMGRLEKLMQFPEDSLPMVRVEIGTGLPASAFGAELLISAENLPAVKTHPIRSLTDLAAVRGPNPVSDGLFPQVYRHIKYFRSRLPPGVHLCQCDLQGPWNTAHLLAGDKIFLDIYDDVELVDRLLDRTTDFMIQAVRKMKEAVGEPWSHFYLQGTKIPGASRLCNCSTDMISGDFYERHLLPCDRRVFDAMGGGFMHICGNNAHCIPHFNKIAKLRGLEVNFNYLDIFKVSDLLREDMVLMCTGPVDPPLLTPLGESTLNRLCRGEYPGKRNILFHFDDPADADKCKRLYDGISRG
jgi:hypothetical protein